MRFSFLSGVRNDLLQEIADQTIYPLALGTPLPIDLSFWANAANHIQTDRQLYTVPVNKRARVKGIAMAAVFGSTPTVVGQFILKCIITPSGGGAIEVFVMNGSGAIIGEGLQNNMPCDYPLAVGDEIKFTSQYQGTIPAGGLLLSGAASIMEFDT